VGEAILAVEPSPETNVGLFRPRTRTLRSRRGERSSFSPHGNMAMEAINDRPPTMQNDYFASWFSDLSPCQVGGNRRYDHAPRPRRAAVLENIRDGGGVCAALPDQKRS
jgi:hypothetical protein